LIIVNWVRLRPVQQLHFLLYAALANVTPTQLCELRLNLAYEIGCHGNAPLSDRKANFRLFIYSHSLVWCKFGEDRRGRRSDNWSADEIVKKQNNSRTYSLPLAKSRVGKINAAKGIYFISCSMRGRLNWLDLC